LIYRFYEFAADIDAGSLTRAGVEVHLRRKSFQVLALLLQHHSRLVSKEEIFTAVWPEIAVTDDVLVGVIGELRKALGDNAETPVYIRTSRRAGYRFIAPIATGVAAVDPPEEIVPVAPTPSVEARKRGLAGMWLAAGLMVGGAGGWLLAGVGFHPHLPTRPAAPVRETGWWRFETGDHRANDASGNRNSGEIHGDARRGSRPTGGTVELDGVHGWIGGTARTLPEAGEPLTFSAWVQVLSTRNDFTNIFQYGYRHEGTSGPFTSTFLALVRPDGRWEAETTGAGEPIVGGRLVDAQWHQIAVRYDGRQTNTASLYMDGEEQAKGKWAQQPEPRANELWAIGQYAFPPATFFHGSVGDVRVFSGALSAHQINALYRCSSGQDSGSLNGEPYFLLPLYGDIVGTLADPADGRINGVRNPGRYFAGAQFARRRESCSLASLQGADMGQDVKISADLLTPRDSAGRHTQAGPYFRSRLASPGDGIMGGASAGYWVALDSNATLTVRRLNPLTVVAYAAIADFDPAALHRLEAVAVGEKLQVKLDGRIVTFEQEGRVTTTVSIPPVWNGPPAIGSNQGGAGIEFAAIDSRGQIGGQEARRITIEPASALWQ
jgi:DNA-binding winged helix-turn-helix (wHTH) protein